MNHNQLLEAFPLIGTINEAYNPPLVHQREYLVNGEMLTWTGPVHEVVSPIGRRDAEGNITLPVIGSYPLTTEKEALAALDAAVLAYNSGRGEWPTMNVQQRLTCMEHFTKLLIASKAEIVKLIVWEIGKSSSDAEKEFDRTVEYIYASIDAMKDLDRDNSRFVIEQGIIGQIRRSSCGVVLCMGPFNYPLNETFTLLIPALIMGNTVLFKTPKHGSLCHYPVLSAFQAAFPAGVVNTIYGRGNVLVSPIIATGKIDVLALIGSSKIADTLKKTHPKTNRLRAILGLDAKNAAIILPDADLDVAVTECMLGALSFNGQRCTALKILFVHESIARVFNDKLCKAIAQLKVGMPYEKGVQITPLPEPIKPAYLQGLIDDAMAHGATILNEDGGLQVGPLCYPALLFPVNSQMRIYREEQFGPLIPVVPFSDVEETIQYLIDSDHGQQVSIFGTNAEEIAKLIDPLVNLVSRVNINAQCQRGPDVFPFTGRKDSAEGTLSVVDALRSFSIRAMVATKSNDVNKAILNEIVNDNDSNFISTRFIL
jgi:acyl-CoA reductase-like NAD-dependent aldehyde dehydrogenase